VNVLIWLQVLGFELRSNDPTHVAMRLQHEWANLSEGWARCVSFTVGFASPTQVGGMRERHRRSSSCDDF